MRTDQVFSLSDFSTAYHHPSGGLDGKYFRPPAIGECAVERCLHQPSWPTRRRVRAGVGQQLHGARMNQVSATRRRGRVQLDLRQKYSPYIRMKTATAKVFQSGNSQALRLPKAFRLRSKTVTLVRTADGFAVKDEAANGRRTRAFAALAGSCPGFPEIAANLAPNLKRHWE